MKKGTKLAPPPKNTFREKPFDKVQEQVCKIYIAVFFCNRKMEQKQNINLTKLLPFQSS